jgi:hypothetical protein
MVFTKAGDIDVTDDDHLIMIFRENGIIDHICDSERSSGEIFRNTNSRLNLLIVLRILESSTRVPGHTAQAFERDLPCQDLHLDTRE